MLGKGIQILLCLHHKQEVQQQQLLLLLSCCCQDWKRILQQQQLLLWLVSQCCCWCCWYQSQEVLCWTVLAGQGRCSTSCQVSSSAALSPRPALSHQSPDLFSSSYWLVFPGSPLLMQQQSCQAFLLSLHSWLPRTVLDCLQTCSLHWTSSSASWSSPPPPCLENGKYLIFVWLLVCSLRCQDHHLPPVHLCFSSASSGSWRDWPGWPEPGSCHCWWCRCCCCSWMIETRSVTERWLWEHCWCCWGWAEWRSDRTCSGSWTTASPGSAQSPGTPGAMLSDPPLQTGTAAASPWTEMTPVSWNCLSELSWTLSPTHLKVAWFSYLRKFIM